MLTTEELNDLPTIKITRLEVIDKDEKTYVNYNLTEIKVSYQDDGMTLKIFVKHS